MNRIRIALVALGAVALAAFAAPAAPATASTGEPTVTGPYSVSELAQLGITDASVNVPPADELTCFAFGIGEFTHGVSCFEFHGDDQWVRDTLTNGRQFRVHSRTEYGKNRFCFDDTPGWTECRRNHRENECVKWHGYYKPHTRHPGEESKDEWPFTPWVGTRLGGGCTPDPGRN